MEKKNELLSLEKEIINCKLCPRLVYWRQDVARRKRRAFLEWDYWGKPVPGFGDINGSVMIVGLAPGAHGSNRTGRMFTGDASGDFLYPALFRAGFTNQPNSENLDDGLILNNIFITAVCRCVPPANIPNLDEINLCKSYLEREIKLIHPKVIVALGRIAFERIPLSDLIWRKGIKFGHGKTYNLNDETILISSYHPSRQNTQTGRLTVQMFDQIWVKVRENL